MNSTTALAITLVVGLFCGLPLFLGAYRRQWVLGGMGFVVTLGSALLGFLAGNQESRLLSAGPFLGTILGLLFAGPIALIFVLLILTRAGTAVEEPRAPGE
jgi:hypothetical protein